MKPGVKLPLVVGSEKESKKNANETLVKKKKNHNLDFLQNPLSQLKTAPSDSLQP